MTQLMYFSDDAYKCDSWGDTFGMLYYHIGADKQDWLWSTLIMLN